MAAHRYWRINFRKNMGDGGFSQIAEVELRAAPGGADQTVPGGAVSVTGTLQAGNAANTISNDGNLATAQWGNTGGVTWTYDLGSSNAQDIVEVAIWGASGAVARSPGDFDIQYSDDAVNFTTAWSCSAAPYTANVAQVFTKPAAAAHRYWRVRMRMSYNASASTLGFSELEMKSAVGGADECVGGTAASRTATGGFGAALAFDDTTTSAYASAAGGAESEWVRYDFGADKDIREVTARGRDDPDLWRQMPRSGWIESSPDGVNFLARWTYNDVVSARPHIQRLIKPGSVPIPAAGKARFWGIRVNATQSAARSFGCATLELRAAVGGVSICTGGQGVSRYPFIGSGGAAAGAFDATLSSIYAGNSLNGGGDILAYDFGVGNEKSVPAEIAIAARPAGTTIDQDQSPTDFELVYSHDGENWTSQQSYTSPATWASNELRLFGVVGGSGGRRRQLIAA